jgi:heme/copper-type cytochrome/quinol oxidase subunit 2
MNLKLIGLILIVALAACTTPAENATVVNNTTAPAVSLTGNVVEVKLNMKNWEFSQTEIRAKKGDRIIIHATSTEGNHGIGIQGYTAHVEVNEGQTQTLGFIADKQGNFTFYCNVPCGSGHREMKGILIVE